MKLYSSLHTEIPTGSDSADLNIFLWYSVGFFFDKDRNLDLSP